MKEINGMTFIEEFDDTGVHIGCYRGCMCSECTLNYSKGSITNRVEHRDGCFAKNLQEMLRKQDE